MQNYPAWLCLTNGNWYMAPVISKRRGHYVPLLVLASHYWGSGRVAGLRAYLTQLSYAGLVMSMPIREARPCKTECCCLRECNNVCRSETGNLAMLKEGNPADMPRPCQHCRSLSTKRTDLAS
jgi:hypothetical protein